jgi:DNA-binding HxlR family transcriptional regulator
VNWQHFMRFLASIRGRWDLAILANLAEGSSRPTELLDAINEQACDGHQLTWKVMRDRLRHLEDAGYVTRREVRRFPRETHYWSTEFARRLVAELNTLDAWYTANAPVPPVNTGPPDSHSCTKCVYALESNIRTSSSETSPPYSF